MVNKHLAGFRLVRSGTTRVERRSNDSEREERREESFIEARSRECQSSLAGKRRPELTNARAVPAICIFTGSSPAVAAAAAAGGVCGQRSLCVPARSLLLCTHAGTHTGTQLLIVRLVAPSARSPPAPLRRAHYSPRREQAQLGLLWKVFLDNLYW